MDMVDSQILGCRHPQRLIDPLIVQVLDQDAKDICRPSIAKAETLDNRFRPVLRGMTRL
jgi:hypothetical protein